MAKQYDEQFKLNALQYLLDHLELSVPAVCRNFGISAATFYKWQQSANQNDGEIYHHGSGNMKSDEENEIARLRRELMNLDDALMILKKMMGILAKDYITIRIHGSSKYQSPIDFENQKISAS